MFRFPGFAALVLLVSITRQAHAAPCEPHPAEHRTANIDGYQREYWLYRPCSAAARPPLVIALHGWGGSAEEIVRDYGWQEQADRFGFVVAFPQALPIRADYPKDVELPPNGNWRHAHNTVGWWTSKQLDITRNTHHPDDLAFLSAFHHLLAATDHVDDSRLFLSGFSNGAFLAKQFALTHGSEVKAVFAAGYVGQVVPPVMPPPVSILEALGTIDDTGGVSPSHWQQMDPVERQYWRGSASERPTVAKDAALWTLIDHCPASPVVEQTAWGSKQIWAHCAHHTSVTFVSVADLGHEWIGASVSRWATSHPKAASLNYTAIAAEFFQQHS